MMQWVSQSRKKIIMPWRFNRSLVAVFLGSILAYMPVYATLTTHITKTTFSQPNQPSVSTSFFNVESHPVQKVSSFLSPTHVLDASIVPEFLAYKGSGQLFSRQDYIHEMLNQFNVDINKKPPLLPAKNIAGNVAILSAEVFDLDKSLKQGWQTWLTLQNNRDINSLALLKQTYNLDYFPSLLAHKMNEKPDPSKQNQFVNAYLSSQDHYSAAQKYQLDANHLLQGNAISAKDFEHFSGALISSSKDKVNSMGDVATLSVVHALLQSLKESYVPQKKQFLGQKKAQLSQMQALEQSVGAPISKSWINKISSSSLSTADLLRVNASLLVINNYLRYQSLKAAKLHQLAEAAEISELVAISKKIH